MGTLATLWFVVLVLTGGLDTTILGISITTHNPLRLLLAAGLAFSLYLLVDGDVGLFLNKPRRLWQFIEAQFMRVAVHDRIAVGTCALALCLFGYVYGTKVAGGSDSWGYLSVTELWLAGTLTVDTSFAKDAPWPEANASFAPLGYRPGPRPSDWSIVPTYSLGLPLLFAIAKKIAGHQAIFWIVPLSGALLVLATFAIGRKLASPAAAVMGAWLLATSPTVLFMIVSPMTDVPVAAFWAGAFYLLLGNSAVSSVGSGIMAGIAVFIRPNLVPIAAVMGLYVLIRGYRYKARWTGLIYGLMFAAGLLPAISAIAWLNHSLYGSALTSGYGNPTRFIQLANIVPNLRLYLGWLMETQTWLGLVGLAAVFFPSRRLWRASPDRASLVVMALVVGTIWLLYLVYDVFDAWWYLRFLLVSFPFILLGTGAALSWLMQYVGSGLRLLLVFLVIGLGTAGLVRAIELGATDFWKGERRYIAAGQLTKRLTPENSVILSLQHSGSIRYYGARVTLRYDAFDAEWIDRAVDWLATRGVSTYLVVELSERAEFERRFAGSRAVEALKRPPVAIYRPGPLFLFDIGGRSTGSSHVPELVTGVDRGLAAVRPEPLPQLVYSK